MRKPLGVSLTVVATVALACCGRRRVDPCASASFNEEACREAVRGGGYYWQGTWYPMTYAHPYPYYYDQYHTYLSRGGTAVSAPGVSYSPPAGSVERGGFGATGESHGGEGSSHGGGAGE